MWVDYHACSFEWMHRPLLESCGNGMGLPFPSLLTAMASTDTKGKESLSLQLALLVLPMWRDYIWQAVEKQKGTMVLLQKAVLPFPLVEHDSKEHRCLCSSPSPYREASVHAKASLYLSLCLYAWVIAKMSFEGQNVEALIRTILCKAHRGLWAQESCWYIHSTCLQQDW